MELADVYDALGRSSHIPMVRVSAEAKPEERSGEGEGEGEGKGADTPGRAQDPEHGNDHKISGRSDESGASSPQQPPAPRRGTTLLSNDVTRWAPDDASTAVASAEDLSRAQAQAREQANLALLGATKALELEERRSQLFSEMLISSKSMNKLLRRTKTQAEAKARAEAKAAAKAEAKAERARQRALAKPQAETVKLAAKAAKRQSGGGLSVRTSPLHADAVPP